MAPTRKLAELFYEIRARTEGLSRDMGDAERQLGKLSKFVSGNVVTATAALGVAILGVGAQASRMAAQVDDSMRRIKAALPAGAEGFEQLRKTIDGLSRQTGKTQQELAQAAEAIARQGASGTGDVINRLRAATNAAQASGEDLNGIISGLDQTLDLFNVAGTETENTLAKLFDATRGKTSLTELFSSMQAAAPTVQRLNLDLDTTAGALVALGDSGLSPKQAVRVLNDFGSAGEAGRREIDKLAASVERAENPMRNLAEAAQQVNDSAANAGARMKAEFSARLIELGQQILPTVNAGLAAMLRLLESVSNKPGSTTTANAFAALTGHSKGISDTTKSLREQQGEYIRTQQAVMTLRMAVQAGTADFRALGKDGVDQVLQSLNDLEAGASKFQIGGEFSADFKKQLDIVRKEADKAKKELEVPAPVAAPGGESPAAVAARLRAAQEGEKELARIRAQGLEQELERVNRELDAYERMRGLERQRRIEFARALIKTERATVDTLVGLFLDIEGRIRASGASEAEIPILRDAELGIKSVRGQLADMDKEFGEIATRGLKRLAELGTKDREEAEKRARKLEEDEQRAYTRGQRLARQIEDISRLTLTAADAFGVLSDEARIALEAVTDIGVGIARIFGSGGQDTAGGIAQGLSGIITLASQLIGKDPAAEERRRQHEQNLSALKAIEKHTGDLAGKSISGGTITSITGGVEQLLALTGDAGGFRRFGDKGPLRGIKEGEFLEGVTGLSFEEIDAVAKSFNITLNGTKQSYLDFLAALKSLDFKAFSETFAGQWAALQQDFEIFDITDPREQLEKFLAILTDPETGAPAIFGSLKDFDLSAPEGIAAFNAEMQDLWRRFKNGEFDASQFPGLDIDQIIQAFGSIDAWIEAMGAAFDQAIAADIAKRSKERSDLGSLLDFLDIDKPFEVLQQGLALALQQFGSIGSEATGLFGDFFKGIDITAEGGLDAFNAALVKAREWLYANAEALGLTDAEIEEMISSIYGLETSADAAAASIKTLAQTLSESFDAIDLNAAIFGTKPTDVVASKLSQLGITGDLSSEGGRNAVIEALRELARATDPADQAMLQLIAGLIGDVQNLASQTGGGGGAGGAAGSGSTSAISSAAQQLTEATGNRMADYLGTLVLLGREHNQVQQDVLAAITQRFVAPVISPPIRPSMGAALVSGFAGAATQSVSTGPLIGPVEIHLPPGSVSPANTLTSLGRAEIRRLATEISKLLAEEVVRARRLKGDVSQ